jgi:hypothetical protein
MKDVALCSLIDGTDISEEPAASVLRMEEGYGGSSEMLVPVHQPTQRDLLDDSNLDTQHCGNLKCSIL